MDKNKNKEVKDKKIRAFKAVVQAEDGFDKVCKKYIHSESSGGVWAYVRHLSENERFAAKAVYTEENILFRIAYSPKITNNLFLEFDGKTYGVVSIDPYEYNKTDLTIRANEVAPPVYDSIEWGNYND